MDILKTSGNLSNDFGLFSGKVDVRKAVPKDCHEVYQIASTVGKNKKISENGFLVDDYTSNPRYYQAKLLENIFELDYFYVAEIGGKMVGFLIAYTKDQWLKYNPSWLEDIHWHPEFDTQKTNDFIVIDKTAIHSSLTGKGIGSRLYVKLIDDIKRNGIYNIFAETIINPVPNFASLAFRKKQHYNLAGVRYEEYNDQILTDLVYHKAAQ